jgi:hypothetical protein
MGWETSDPGAAHFSSLGKAAPATIAKDQRPDLRFSAKAIAIAGQADGGT